MIDHLPHFKKEIMLTIKFDEWAHLKCELLLQEISKLEETKEIKDWSKFALDSFNTQINDLFNQREMILDILNSERKPVYATIDEEDYFSLRNNDAKQSL